MERGGGIRAGRGRVSHLPRTKKRQCPVGGSTAVFPGARCRWLPNHLRVSASARETKHFDRPRQRPIACSACFSGTGQDVTPTKTPPHSWPMTEHTCATYANEAEGLRPRRRVEGFPDSLRSLACYDRSVLIWIKAPTCVPVPRRCEHAALSWLRKPRCSCGRACHLPLAAVYRPAPRLIEFAHARPGRDRGRSISSMWFGDSGEGRCRVLY